MIVTAGLVPAIDVFICARRQGVDARDKPGHDADRYYSAALTRASGSASMNPPDWRRHSAA